MLSLDSAVAAACDQVLNVVSREADEVAVDRVFECAAADRILDDLLTVVGEMTERIDQRAAEAVAAADPVEDFEVRAVNRLGEFAGPTESSAFWIRGWEGLKSHWMKLENAAKGMSVLIEDGVPVCNFYSWNNFNAFCPEVFAPIDLESGESVSYRRSYTFEVK